MKYLVGCLFVVLLQASSKAQIPNASIYILDSSDVYSLENLTFYSVRKTSVDDKFVCVKPKMAKILIGKDSVYKIKNFNGTVFHMVINRQINLGEKFSIECFIQGI